MHIMTVKQLAIQLWIISSMDFRVALLYNILMSGSALTSALNQHDLTPRTSTRIPRSGYPTSAFVTHLVYLSDSSIQVDQEALTVRAPVNYKLTLTFDGQRCAEAGGSVRAGDLGPQY
jgi:hypothetical protein